MAALLRDDRGPARDALLKVARSPAPPEFPATRAQAELGLARLALRDGEADAAVRALSRVHSAELPAELARSVAQLRADAWLAHGEVLQEEVEHHLRAALQTWPDDVALLRALRELRTAARDREETVALQRRIAELAPARSRASERSRLIDELLAAAESALATPADDRAHTRAVAWIDEARALAPDDARPGCLLGDLELRKGNVLGAMRAWGRTRSRQGLDRVAALVEERPEAVSVRELLEACPLDGALLIAARIYARRGQPEEAVRAARLAARRAGPTPTIVAAVADVFDRCNLRDEADALRREASHRALGLAHDSAAHR